MSCHHIGRGLNEVVRKVLVEYDVGLIPCGSAIRILHQCAKSVHWCDGNEYEATACMYDRCGRCLRKGLPMFSIDIPYENREAWALLDKESVGLHLCQDCIDKLEFQGFADRPWDVEKEAEHDYFG